MNINYLCTVEKEEIIKSLSQLGALMCDLGENKPWSNYSSGVTEQEYNKLVELIERQHIYNGWFTADNVRRSLKAQGEWLNETSLTNWLSAYRFTDQPKTVAVIMAGNIPLVGFHDFVCVLASGNKIIAKLSSEDKMLLPELVEVLYTFDPRYKERIELSVGRVSGFDAVIATGSDNSALYFEQYFGKYPHIFRKNRTSIAVLNGSETEEELKSLGDDIFSYFGLGCRNVTHLAIPKDYDLKVFFEAIFPYSDVIYNKKYGNNYDYNKAIFLLNKHNLLDNNFVLLRQSDDLFSPISMINYHVYGSPEELDAYLKTNDSSIQVVIGKDYTPFGTAQCPQLNDYADGVDVMQWLSEL